MKRLSSLLILVLSLAVLLNSCGGGGGGTTTIGNPTQGAQAEITTRNVADDVIGSFGLSDLVGSSSLADGSRTAKALRKFAQRIKPVIQKSRLFKATVTEEPCADGGSIITDDTGKIIYKNCKESGTWTDGVMISTYSDDYSTLTVTFGENGKPYVETSYSDSSYTDKSSEFRALCSLSLSVTDYESETNYTETITGNGYIENEYWYDTSSTKEYIVMNNFIFTGDYAEDTITGTFDIKNSSITESYYENGNLIYSKQTSFNNFNLVNKVDYTYEYLTINGTFSIDLTPDDTACFEGTFKIVTNEDIKTNSEGQTIDGQITINDNTIVEYNSDGSITVTVKGQSPRTFRADEIDNLSALCSQLI
ncbi:MAG: hypothetical protein AB1478_00300 [Nitrospirota bacterium]